MMEFRSSDQEIISPILDHKRSKITIPEESKSSVYYPKSLVHSIERKNKRLKQMNYQKYMCKKLSVGQEKKQEGQNRPYKPRKFKKDGKGIKRDHSSIQLSLNSRKEDMTLMKLRSKRITPIVSRQSQSQRKFVNKYLSQSVLSSPVREDRQQSPLKKAGK